MPELRSPMDRIKSVERGYLATADAIRMRKQSILDGDAPPPSLISRRDLEAADDNLESTYLVRVWAEFETALRSYRFHVTGKDDDPIAARSLIDWTSGVRQGRSISTTVVDDVHQVREYRNHLVHDRDDDSPPSSVTIVVARRRLNLFLQKLPERW